MKNLFLILTIIFLFIITGCSSCFKPNMLPIKYNYSGEFGRYGIASNAFAFSEYGELVAKAQSVKIITTSSGPNHLLVEEEHYNVDGKIIYKGNIEFEFGFNSAHIVSEKALSGKKCFSAFTSWPCFSGY